MTDEVLRMLCKQSKNSEENLDEIYEPSLGIDVTPCLGPAGFMLPVPWASLLWDRAKINPAQTDSMPQDTEAVVAETWRERSAVGGSAPGEGQCLRNSTSWSIFSPAT